MTAVTVVLSLMKKEVLEMAIPLDPSSGFFSVADLVVGDEARVIEINYRDPRQLQKLLAMGVLPGVKITLLQRFPAFVLQVGRKKIALDQNLARAIWITKAEKPQES